MQTFVSKIADTWSEAELTGKSGDTATVCLLAEYRILTRYPCSMLVTDRKNTEVRLCD